MLIMLFTVDSHFFNDAIFELNPSDIIVVITDTREQSYYLEPEETERLSSILGSLEMKKKIIPNRPAFNEDAVIIVSSTNPEESFTIMFDYERNIIGINQYHKNLKQYILEHDSDLFLFVQSYLKE
ncbi:hypothetical protein [Lysinibacillus irui]|uniref:hypothetical protein n=1 Tax=Lysinibacillus irui TaxID=2998077 RepID=UPI002AD2A3C0|nr:hypothetical protein [Lysinibacillus irui]